MAFDLRDVPRLVSESLYTFMATEGKDCTLSIGHGHRNSDFHMTQVDHLLGIVQFIRSYIDGVRDVSDSYYLHEPHPLAQIWLFTSQADQALALDSSLNVLGLLETPPADSTIDLFIVYPGDVRKRTVVQNKTKYRSLDMIMAIRSIHPNKKLAVVGTTLT